MVLSRSAVIADIGCTDSSQINAFFLEKQRQTIACRCLLKGLLNDLERFVERRMIVNINLCPVLIPMLDGQ